MCVPCEELLTTEHILLINFCSDSMNKGTICVYTGIFFKEISLDYVFQFLEEMGFWVILFLLICNSVFKLTMYPI